MDEWWCDQTRQRRAGEHQKVLAARVVTLLSRDSSACLHSLSYDQRRRTAGRITGRRCCHWRRSIVGQLEPQVLRRDRQRCGPGDELVEIGDGVTALDAADLRLGETKPTGDDVLRQWAGTVRRVVPVGPDDLAHVP